MSSYSQPRSQVVGMVVRHAQNGDDLIASSRQSKSYSSCSLQATCLTPPGVEGVAFSTLRSCHRHMCQAPSGRNKPEGSLVTLVVFFCQPPTPSLVAPPRSRHIKPR